MLTGSRTNECPPDARGWARFKLAAATVMHHEIAIAVTGIGIIALTWDAPNQVATLTYVILWAMRLSAKLNIYFGVPNFTDDLLPDHLSYLKSYFPQKPINSLFPVSITLGTLACVTLYTTTPDATAFQFTAAGLTGGIMALALLEHWLLVLPLPDSALWKWAMPSNETTQGDEPMTSKTPQTSDLETPQQKPKLRLVSDEGSTTNKTLEPAAPVLEAHMTYDAIFEEAISDLHREGRYRVFADLKRRCGQYPHADHYANGTKRLPTPAEVRIWCSNDYLGMSQHPKVLSAMHEAIDTVGAGSGGTR
ncbi:MAG: putative photosynthetic complex assembly protein PuhE, partial [Pseudomonadota bacterium]